MCGIAGYYQYQPVQDHPGKDVIEQMTDALVHRGPDGRGVYIEPRLGLGHRRLAIIDPGPSGAQPMTSCSGRTTITYNGEIYNFREIRKALESKGYEFQSRSDTEVILNAYEEWGISCVKQFNGIFAFGIWDRQESILYLVRDRFGVKPLFYSDFDGVIRFASEPKAILKDPTVTREVDLAGLNSFLTLGYIHAPLTGYKRIRQVEPGKILACRPTGPEIESFWTWEAPQEHAFSFNEATERFSQILRGAVGRQMVSDVPIGAFLSGGLDSTAIVSAMTHYTSSKLRTFTIGFSEQGYDESAVAAQTARTLQTEHVEEIISMDLAEDLPSIVNHCDDPFSDSSLVCTYYLAKATGSHVKVALSGDGADELLGGYSTYRAGQFAPVFRYLPRLLREFVISKVLHLLPITDNPYNLRQLSKRFLAGLSYPPGLDHASWRTYFSPETKRQTLSPDLLGTQLSLDPLRQYSSYYHDLPEESHPLKKMLYSDLMFYLPNDILTKVDRMSMAHGLEVRVPFLDNDLVDFCLRLPPSFLLGPRGAKKRILRHSLRDSFPADHLRRPKHGFNLPIGKLLRNELFQVLMDAIRTKPFSESGPFVIQNLENMAIDHREKRIDASYELFTTLILALWWNSAKVHLP